LIYQEFKQYDSAINDFSKAIQFGNESLYYRNRSECYLEINLYSEALKDLDNAIQINERNNKPDISEVNKNGYNYDKYLMDVALYKSRAKVKKVLRDIEGAESDLEKYCSLKYIKSSQEKEILYNEVMNGNY